LSHHPELLGHAVHEEVDGLDIGGNMVDGLFFFATEEAIPHLCKEEQKRPTLVWRRLSRTHAVLGRDQP